MPKAPGKWSPGRATQEINKCAKSDSLSVSWKLHAKEQMRERGIIMGDVLHVLKRGFVYSEPINASRPGYHKYLVEATTPNSDGRAVGVVVIPDDVACELKIITVMWRDES
ncbi:MAG: hypothetical protein CGW95_15395 [Phenylobacterium zucineum]|nr:MAG: hypothetical protein CGW95_15395 [Phenylobacterium zucineum]